MNAKFIATFTNLVNYNQLDNPTLSITSPQTFGVISGQTKTPRQMEFGRRLGSSCYQNLQRTLGAPQIMFIW